MKQNIYSFPSPISTSSKSLTEHCNSKTFHILQNILRNIHFFFTNFSQGTSLKKKCNTACTLTHSSFFVKRTIVVGFVKLLIISLDDKCLICRVFIKAEMILFCKYAEFCIIWPRIFSNEFLHSSLIQFF